MLVTFLVIMLLQPSRLSWTLSLGSCIFPSSECPGVIEIVTLFHFEYITWKETQGQARAFLVVWLCPKAEILLCCYVRLLVAFFWMWDWIRTGLSYRLWSSGGPAKLHCRHRLWVRTILPLIADHLGSADVRVWTSPSFWALRTLSSCSHIVALSSPSLTFTVFPSLSQHPSPRPLDLSTHLLSLCESVALRGRASFFWKPAIGRDMMGQGTNQ